jgi:hypothetical protein
MSEQGVSELTMALLRNGAPVDADCRAILAALKDAARLRTENEKLRRLATRSVLCGGCGRRYEYIPGVDEGGREEHDRLAAVAGDQCAALEDAAKWRGQRVVGRLVGMDVVSDPAMPPDEIQFRTMVACPTCGNKRCPGVNGNPCTGSNAPGQPGSNYEDVARAAEGEG